MAKVINASVPDALLPTWEMLVAEYDGPSAFLQDLLRAVKRTVESGPTDVKGTSLYRIALEEKVVALLAERQAIDASIAALKEAIIGLDKRPVAPGSTTPPPKRRDTPEEFVEFWAASLTKRSPEQLTLIAKNNGYDVEQFLGLVAARRDAPSEASA